MAFARKMIGMGAMVSAPTAILVGPNWAVNTSPAYALKAQKAIGGQIFYGKPVKPAPTAVAAAPPAFAPQTLLTLSGSGTQTTERFTIGGSGDWESTGATTRAPWAAT